VCHGYSDLNFGVTFFGTQCITGRRYFADIIGLVKRGRDRIDLLL